jgi:hypothetical protein
MRVFTKHIRLIYFDVSVILPTQRPQGKTIAWKDFVGRKTLA